MRTPGGVSVPSEVCERAIKANQIAKISRRSEGVVPMNFRAIFYAPFFMPPRAKNEPILADLSDVSVSIRGLFNR